MKLPSILPAAAVALLLTACGPQAPATPDTTAEAPASAPAALALATEPASATANATASAADAAPAAAATAAGTDPGSAAPDGKAIYNRTCALCHATGTAGAPKPGDSADWEPRLAQGMDVIYKHALEGFTGQKGVMPPRGGAANLSDEEIKAAADFMAGSTG